MEQMSLIKKTISKELGITEKQVDNTLELLEQGNTIPFIARYRKEVTSNLDEEQIRSISEVYQYQVQLNKRKEDVKRLIEQQAKLTPELEQQIDACTKLVEVEDIYRPYQQKRKTRATEAIRKGLKPLAKLVLQLPKEDISNLYPDYFNEEVTSVEAVISGVKDIIAEEVNNDIEIREQTRTSYLNYGKVICSEKKNHNDDNKVYLMYYDYEERISNLQPHRIMAMMRAEKENVINLKLVANFEYLSRFVQRKFLKRKTEQDTSVYQIILDAINDGLTRLLYPSVEREIKSLLFEKASEQSIDVFSENLEHLLSQPPLKKKAIMGFDPAFRTGCKLAIIDETGKVLHIDAIYPHQPQNKKQASAETLVTLVNQYGVEIIAIGNGTASRESESFVADVIKKHQLNTVYTIVSEAGASVYSASDLAREEFPDLEVQQRSAISIARRILDPLSELIKIDPKAIGVGQYQHDLPEKRLEERLTFAVSKTVNRVGVDINTASEHLLTYVSGLNKGVAKEIVKYRMEHGVIHSRKELLKIKKFGEQAFKQAAGFLRIKEGEDILDQTSIHPESYDVAHKIIEMFHIETIGSEACQEILNKVNLKTLSRELMVDAFTLEDILEDLKQPLRDYRDQYDAPILKNDVLHFEDLTEGMQLEGVVRNVVDFGAFVDIGLKNDSLVHISKLAPVRVKHPSDVVSVGDIVKVTVFKIDTDRKLVQLSMID